MSRVVRGKSGRRPKDPRRGSRALSVVSGVLFAGFLVFYCWAWVAIGPARAYTNAVLCPARAAPDAPCLVRGTATIAKTVGHLVNQVTDSGTTNSKVGEWDVTITGNGRIPDATFKVFADYPLMTGSRVGDTVTVAFWRGHLDSVTNHLGTAQIGVSPVGDLRTVDFAAALLLASALGTGWLGRVRLPRRRPRWRRLARASDVPGCRASPSGRS